MLGAEAGGGDTVRRLLLLSLVFGLGVSHVSASFQFSPDTPTKLMGMTYLPSQVVQNDAGNYSLTLALPNGTLIDGLHHMNNGDWLISVATPAVLGGTMYDPRDVVRRDAGGSFTLFFAGAAAGIPQGSNVDTIFLDGGDTGDLILSFDVPTAISGPTYEPADLVRFHGGAFSLYFDASEVTPPIPITTNVRGAARAGVLLVLAFDVPTKLGSLTFLPGDLVSWNGSAFAFFSHDTRWPISSRVNAVTGITCGAEVCDGTDDDCDGSIPVAEADVDGDGFRGCAGDCNDANPAIHPGAPDVCDTIDNDCNGLVDDLDADGDGVGLCFGDCDDTNPAVIAAPGLIEDLQAQPISGAVRYTWTSQAATAGAGTVYDAFAGTIAGSGTINFAAGACAGNNLASNMYDEAALPLLAGTVRYFMFRGQNACGTGSYGTAARDAGATASANPCP